MKNFISAAFSFKHLSCLSYAKKKEEKMVIKVPFPKGETGSRRAQEALNYLYISHCIRFSRDYVSDPPATNLHADHNLFSLSTETREDHSNGLIPDPVNGGKGGGRGCGSGSGSECGRGSGRGCGSGCGSVICDTICLNKKGMILPIDFNLMEENIHMYSIINLNKNLSILRKAPRLPPRACTVDTKLAVRAKGARRKVKAKVKVKPEMSLIRTHAEVRAKCSPLSNPLRISEEDPETFFLYN